jgi:signal transduction histidine kinase
VRDLRQSCRMMSELTTNLKQFLRPGPTETPATDPLPIIQYTFSVCREISVRAKGKQQYEGPRELPRVRISSTELMQILINLVNNANQAMLASKPSNPLVTVRVKETDDGMVRFVVSDNGPGMTAEVQQKAGTPFFSTKREGTGLGLAQCRRLVERAGGELKIASVDGAGTNVSFTLPKANR